MANKAILASAVALTTSPVASTQSSIVGCDKHAIYVLWTPGTSGNVLTITVETSPDGTNWCQDMVTPNSGGALTAQRLTFTHTATGTTLVTFRLDVNDVQGDRLRIKYSESEAGGATKGTITAYSFPSAS